MAIEVFLPRLTHEMKQGILVRWLKADGDRVEVEEPLFEIETDKAISEVVASASGILRHLDYQPGAEIPIGSVLAYILVEGEPLPSGGGQGGSSSGTGASANPAPPREKAAASAAEPPVGHPNRVNVTPIAKRIAREKGLDLSRLTGSGPRGRIIERDVWAYLDQQASPAAEAPSGLEAPYSVVPLTRWQIVTGQRMAHSSQTIPQFVLEIDAEMSAAQNWRAAAGEGRGRPPGYTAVLVKVAAEALKRHPQVNASLDGEALRMYKEVNVGVAMATLQGLLVAVIRRADELHLDQIQDKLDEIRKELRAGSLPPAYLSGGTFTVSNLGMYGIDRFQALVNPPEAAILAAGRIREQLMPGAGGMELRPAITLRLSVDHRVLDGAAAAPFLVEVKDLLENPYRML